MDYSKYLVARRGEDEDPETPETDSPKGYYDINTEVKNATWGLADLLYLKDLKQRKLYLYDVICDETIGDVVRNILQFNREDFGVQVEQRQPILLYVTSRGGVVTDGFELIDVIRASKTPVYTINLGYQYSMGFLIGLAGHKRFCTKTSTFLLHDGDGFVYNSSSKMQDQVHFQQKLDDRIKAYVLERTNITSREYDKNIRVEWYFFSDEAKARGITDYIIGEDCDVDEIV